MSKARSQANIYTDLDSIDEDIRRIKLALSQSVPEDPGDIKWTARINPTPGWLLCSGAAVSRTTYADLFAAITIPISATSNSTVNLSGITSTAGIGIGMPLSGTGVQAGTTVTAVGANTLTLSLATTASGTLSIIVAPFGVGDGSTTFNLPDMTGRIPMGAGTGSGLTARVLGIKHGAETVTLTSAQSGIPAHTHTTSVGTQSANHTHGPGASAHYLMWDTATISIAAGAFAATPNASSAVTGVEGQTHTHAVTVNANSAANAASSHPNIPPATVLNAVIKI